MLLTVWSPKGGTGTTTIAVALSALIASEHGDVRLLDFVGDGASIIGARIDRNVGVHDWLAVGSSPPNDALDALSIAIGERFRYIPPGNSRGLPTAAASASLADATRRSSAIVVADCGHLHDAPERALVEAGDLSIAVIRPCFLTMARSVRCATWLQKSCGFVFVDEPHRSLSAKQCAGILGRPLLAAVPCSPDIARTIDSGVLLRRRPQPLFKPLDGLCRRLGILSPERLRSVS